MAEKIALDADTWRLTHDLCARVDAGAATNDDVAALTDRFLASVTCGCQAHIRTYLAEAPPRGIAAGRAFEWSWRFHDQVNDRLQKASRLTLLEARRAYAASFAAARTRPVPLHEEPAAASTPSDPTILDQEVVAAPLTPSDATFRDQEIVAAPLTPSETMILDQEIVAERSDPVPPHPADGLPSSKLDGSPMSSPIGPETPSAAAPTAAMAYVRALDGPSATSAIPTVAVARARPNAAQKIECRQQ